MNVFLRQGDKPLVEACSPVQTNESEAFSVVTTRPTHNTGEMQALIEALFWLSSFVEQNILQASNNVLFTVDSLYVKGLIEDKFVARENRVLATLLRHMRGVTKKRSQLHIRWVRGRTGDMGNSIADSLADTGTLTELQHRWWRRWPPNGGWEEEVFAQKVVSIQRETTPCEDARRLRLDRPGGLAPRFDPSSHELIAALGSVTTATATSAIKWGAARCRKLRLQPGDPAKTELQKQMFGVSTRKRPLESSELFHRSVSSTTSDATKAGRSAVQRGN